MTLAAAGLMDKAGRRILLMVILTPSIKSHGYKWSMYEHFCDYISNDFRLIQHQDYVNLMPLTQH